MRHSEQAQLCKGHTMVRPVSTSLYVPPRRALHVWRRALFRVACLSLTLSVCFTPTTIDARSWTDGAPARFDGDERTELFEVELPSMRELRQQQLDNALFGQQSQATAKIDPADAEFDKLTRSSGVLSPKRGGGQQSQAAGRGGCYNSSDGGLQPLGCTTTTTTSGIEDSGTTSVTVLGTPRPSGSSDPEKSFAPPPPTQPPPPLAPHWAATEDFESSVTAGGKTSSSGSDVTTEVLQQQAARVLASDQLKLPRFSPVPSRQSLLQQVEARASTAEILDACPGIDGPAASEVESEGADISRGGTNCGMITTGAEKGDAGSILTSAAAASNVPARLAHGLPHQGGREDVEEQKGEQTEEEIEDSCPLSVSERIQLFEGLFGEVLQKQSEAEKRMNKPRRRGMQSRIRALAADEEDESSFGGRIRGDEEDAGSGKKINNKPVEDDVDLVDGGQQAATREDMIHSAATTKQDEDDDNSRRPTRSTSVAAAASAGGNQPTEGAFFIGKDPDTDSESDEEVPRPARRASSDSAGSGGAFSSPFSPPYSTGRDSSRRDVGREGGAGAGLGFASSARDEGASSGVAREDEVLSAMNSEVVEPATGASSNTSGGLLKIISQRMRVKPGTKDATLTTASATNAVGKNPASAASSQENKQSELSTSSKRNSCCVPPTVTDAANLTKAQRQMQKLFSDVGTLFPTHMGRHFDGMSDEDGRAALATHRDCIEQVFAIPGLSPEYAVSALRRIAEWLRARSLFVEELPFWVRMLDIEQAIHKEQREALIAELALAVDRPGDDDVASFREDEVDVLQRRVDDEDRRFEAIKGELEAQQTRVYEFIGQNWEKTRHKV
ncbi:unnamed protein product [Amoebophrya sp. A120]|nr:unnamed protein product [Amoebophrya sp. A120]|eukprot:GSA120T00013012001.1